MRHLIMLLLLSSAAFAAGDKKGDAPYVPTILEWSILWLEHLSSQGTSATLQKCGAYCQFTGRSPDKIVFILHYPDRCSKVDVDEERVFRRKIFEIYKKQHRLDWLTLVEDVSPI